MLHTAGQACGVLLLHLAFSSMSWSPDISCYSSFFGMKWGREGRGGEGLVGYELTAFFFAYTFCFSLNVLFIFSRVTGSRAVVRSFKGYMHFCIPGYKAHEARAREVRNVWDVSL